MFAGEIHGEVLIGHRGDLYLAGGNHSVLEYIDGTRRVTEGARRIFRENLVARSRECSKRGLPFCHLVAPDKHSVQVENFPREIKFSLGQEYLSFCDGLFFYPVSELSADGRVRSYLKTDTHWNLDGQVIFTKFALNKLGIDQSETDPLFLDLINTAYHVNISGDLGSKLTPRQSEDTLRIRKYPDVLIYSNNVSGSNGTIQVSVNLSAPERRLLIFCDSFVMSCLPILALFFREILLIRSPYFHEELLSLFQPSHVLSSNVERYLPNMPTDKEAPVALLMPSLLKKDVHPDVGFYAALNATLRFGTLAHNRFITKLTSSQIA